MDLFYFVLQAYRASPLDPRLKCEARLLQTRSPMCRSIDTPQYPAAVLPNYCIALYPASASISVLHRAHRHTQFSLSLYHLIFFSIVALSTHVHTPTTNRTFEFFFLFSFLRHSS